jgi:hypothetical protein
MVRRHLSVMSFVVVPTAQSLFTVFVEKEVEGFRVRPLTCRRAQIPLNNSALGFGVSTPDDA